MIQPNIKACRNHCSALDPLLQVINQMLIQLAKTKLDSVITEAHDTQVKLQTEFSLSTTDELANSLTFLDETKERVRKAFHFKSSFFINYK